MSSRRNPQKLLSSLLCICGLVVVSALLPVEQASGDPASKVCVQDDLSRHVCVPAYPTRVICLAPSLTETMFELGAGHALVGRTAACNVPGEALRVKDIGGYMNPDLERIIALKPDLVLSPEIGMRKEVVKRLTDLGIPVFVENSNTLDEIARLMERLGIILGIEAEAEIVARGFQERRQVVRAKIARLNRPLILVAIGVRPLVVAGGKSFIGSLIREAGGVNVAEEAGIPYPKFSMEEVVRRDPDLIVVLNKECRDAECFNHWRQHRALKAVANNRIYQLDADLITRPSPKIVDALEQLAAILHPEIFGEVLSTEAMRLR